MTNAPAPHLHGHGHGDGPDVEISRRARLVVLALLIAVGLATVTGLVALWPADVEPDEGVAAQFAAPGVTSPARRSSRCCTPATPTSSPRPAVAPPPCAVLEVQLRSGPEQGDTAQVEVIGPRPRRGRARRRRPLVRIPSPEGAADLHAAEAQAPFSFFGVDRTTPRAPMAGLFALVARLEAAGGVCGTRGAGVAGWVASSRARCWRGSRRWWSAGRGQRDHVRRALPRARGPMRTRCLVATTADIGITAALAEVAVVRPAQRRATRVGERLSAIQPGLRASRGC